MSTAGSRGGGSWKEPSTRLRLAAPATSPAPVPPSTLPAPHQVGELFTVPLFIVVLLCLCCLWLFHHIYAGFVCFFVDACLVLQCQALNSEKELWKTKVCILLTLVKSQKGILKKRRWKWRCHIVNRANQRRLIQEKIIILTMVSPQENKQSNPCTRSPILSLF